MIAPPGASESTVDQAGVRAALMHLVRLAAVQRLRRDDGGEGAGQTEQFATRLSTVLGDAEAPVVLEIRPEGVFCEDQKMIGDDVLAAHLCRTLYHEGLRAIFIEPQASLAELERLARLLARDWGSRAVFEPDLQAAAWQNRFEAVHIDAIAGRIEEAEAGDEGALVARLMRQLAASDLSEGADSLGDLLGVLRRFNDAAPRGAYQDEGTAAVEHPEEFEVFSRELESIREDKDALEPAVGRVLFEALRSGHDDAFVEDIARHLAKQIQHLLADGHPAIASALLHRPLLLQDPALFPDHPRRDALARGLQPLSGPPTWDAIQQGFQRVSDPGAWRGPLFTLTQAMAPADLDAIVAAAGALPHRQLRQAVADGVVTLARRGERPLRDVFAAAHGPGLRVALLSLAREPDATLSERLMALYSSPDVDVREAALTALRQQQSPRIKEIMRRALSDDAEPVRREALRYLAVYRDVEGAKLILEQLNRFMPGDREADELAALTRALVHMLHEEAVPHLKVMALQPRVVGFLDLADALLAGLHAAGAPGLAALDEVALARADLRPRIRKLIGKAG